jgi:thiamine biosynthesis lipoprotein
VEEKASGEKKNASVEAADRGAALAARAGLRSPIFSLHAKEKDSGEGKTVGIERRLGFMGTTLALEVQAADRAAALAASERAVEALEAAETRLSTWRDGGELARLNRAPVGVPVALSPALGRELAAARACWRETGGAFDPAIGKLVAAWGLRSGGKIPGEDERAAAVAAGGMAGLRLVPGFRTPGELRARAEAATANGVVGLDPLSRRQVTAVAVRERAGVIVDEGGFGKGAGLAAALTALAKAPGVTAATLDLGGQLAFLGGGRREVLVADPRRRDRPVVALTVEGGSVSTSGNGERGMLVAGRRVGHLLDPRRGAPAPDFGSLTVWTADPLRADCLSTGLFVLGPEAALAWAAAHPGVEVLAVVVENGRLGALASPGLAGRLTPLVAHVTTRDRKSWRDRDGGKVDRRGNDKPGAVDGGLPTGVHPPPHGRARAEKPTRA